MIDLILADRLTALAQSLQGAGDPSSWKAKLDLHNVEVEDRIWDLAIMDIKREVSRISSVLTGVQDRVRTGNSGSAEWQTYSEIHRASQELFRDSLELIGGLALRDKLLDQEICQLTDELILNCSDAMTTNTSPTIPAHLELPPRMLRRVVRMRYPEWTIWTLSFAAYEFGHIAMAEIDELKKYCETQAEEAVQAQGTAPDSAAYGNLVQRAIHSAKILMADAFATYTLGPAYACPALLLQFSPVPDEPAVAFGPSGTQRADLVLGILEGMGREGNQDDGNAFEVVLRPLRERWAFIPHAALGPEHIVLDPASILDIFSRELYQFRPRVRYPTGRLNEKTFGGWTVARQWEEQWQDELKNRVGTLTVPAVHSASKLRDGLNAAWLCRLRTPPESLSYVERVSRDLCLEIIKERSTARRNPGRRAANLRPRSPNSRG